ncbi:MAG TPA: transcription/translation regulatory transformer protein RfaH [Noviherbaspirillum sp.]|nr:transcription/translation regulatory transformer protein RfaH [Noviherbaspirillum sp.]
MNNPSHTGGASWHVVQTKPKQEFRALEHLQNQGFTCCLPTLKTEKIIRGKVDACIEPLFSRYLFVRLSAANGNWSPIRSTRGVSKLVAFGGRFATLPDACVEALQGVQQMSPQRLFEPGERVAITSGPFAGLEGIYQLPDGEARALVLIELMNQPQKLRLAVESLRKAA